MRFWMVLLFALALATAGGFLHQHQLMVYDGVNITYVVFILSGLILLFLSALILNRSNGGNFDIVVASESIVAFGIASLTGGVVVGLSQALVVDDFAKIGKGEIGNIAMPFLEGVFIAATAPILAAVLRNIDSHSGEPSLFPGVEATTVPGMNEDIKKMVELISALTKQISELQEATKASGYSMEGFRTKINEHTDQLKAAFIEASAEIKGMAASAGEARGSIQKLGTALSAINAPVDQMIKLSTSLSTITVDSEQLKLALVEAQTHIKGMATASNAAVNSIKNLGTNISDIRSSSDAMKDVSASFGKLKSETEKTAMVLDGLRKIIASFEGFIGRDRRAA